MPRNFKTAKLQGFLPVHSPIDHDTEIQAVFFRQPEAQADHALTVYPDQQINCQSQVWVIAPSRRKVKENYETLGRE